MLPEYKPQRNNGRPLAKEHVEAIRAAKLARRAARLYADAAAELLQPKERECTTTS